MKVLSALALLFLSSSHALHLPMASGFRLHTAGSGPAVRVALPTMMGEEPSAADVPASAPAPATTPATPTPDQGSAPEAGLAIPGPLIVLLGCAALGFMPFLKTGIAPS